MADDETDPWTNMGSRSPSCISITTTSSRNRSRSRSDRSARRAFVRDIEAELRSSLAWFIWTSLVRLRRLQGLPDEIE